ncbi:MAG: DUF882 domain-containing protein [Desulfobacteraceae bacterium]|nr:MAG: DUF882 domain-containing protein [Desulfobacteraceae bacterium]
MPTAEHLTDHCRAAEPIHRRRFLRLGLLAASVCLLPRPVSAALQKKNPPERRLSFFNTHTGESLEACYFHSGCYEPKALRAIYHILRDHRSGEIHPIDGGLLDLLYTLSLRLGDSRPFHVISGYRSAETNATLHRRNRGVASQSLHVYGKAIDIRVPGVHTCDLGGIARSQAAGGVGYYPQSDFVHLDVGRVRTW